MKLTSKSSRRDPDSGDKNKHVETHKQSFHQSCLMPFWGKKLTFTVGCFGRQHVAGSPLGEDCRLRVVCGTQLSSKKDLCHRPFGASRYGGPPRFSSEISGTPKYKPRCSLDIHPWFPAIFNLVHLEFPMTNLSSSCVSFFSVVGSPNSVKDNAQTVT